MRDSTSPKVDPLGLHRAARTGEVMERRIIARGDPMGGCDNVASQPTWHVHVVGSMHIHCVLA